MAAAVPLVLSGLSTASTIKQSRDSRKSQKESLAQQERAIAAQPGKEQSSRSPADALRRRRRGSSPGFNDAGAASLVGGTGSTLLGQ